MSSLDEKYGASVGPIQRIGRCRRKRGFGMAITKHSSVWRSRLPEASPTGGTSTGRYAKRIARSGNDRSADCGSSDRESLTWVHDLVGRTIDFLTRFTVLLERR